jgi:hypothetical protein
MAPLKVPTSRGIKLPRLRLNAPPARGSSALNNAGRQVVRGHAFDIPAYESEAQFLSTFDPQQGEHITAVGYTQSGKTTLMTHWILPAREHCVVLATKRRDPVLYPTLKKLGFEMTNKPALDVEERPLVIYRPDKTRRKNETAKDVKVRLRAGYAEVLGEVEEDGGWGIYGDEIRFLAKDLKLEEELEVLWLQGSSELITMMVSTQRPVAIPTVAFESASHLFLFRTTDRRNIERIAEFEGANEALLNWLLPRLEQHEVLYIETRTGRMVRTKVEI